MKKSSPFKRVLSLLLCLTVILGLMPETALAVGGDADDPPALTDTLLSSDPTPVSGGSTGSYQENAEVSVTYDDVNRTHATVKYHKPGVPANAYNLVFLVDASYQGRESEPSFGKMLHEGGENLIVGSNDKVNHVSLITYKQSANLDHSGYMNNGFWKAYSKVESGAGTANELAALDKAINEVKNLQDPSAPLEEPRFMHPTIVIWVLGDTVVEKQNKPDEIEKKLKELKDILEADPFGSNAHGALITWQLGTDTPDDLLAKYATEHTGAHDNNKVTAAYTSKDPTEFRMGMKNTLESILHDHYHNITFNLALNENQTIIKKVNGIYLESDLGSSRVTATPAPDHKSVELHLDYLCQQLDYDLVFDLELKDDVYETQTVINGGTFVARHDASNGGLHTGIFDDQINTSLTTTFPAAVVDRALKTITFSVNDGSGTAPASLSALAGQRVTLPDGEGLKRTKNGVTEYFGGWDIAGGANNGKFYLPGTEIEMPENGLTLNAAYGHLEVELDVASVAPIGLDNRLDKRALRDIFLESAAYRRNITQIHVIDKTFNYNYDETTREVADLANIRAVAPTVEKAYHLGIIEHKTDGTRVDSRVIGYLVPDSNSTGNYELYIAGPGGVTAPTDSSELFKIDEQLSANIGPMTTIHLDALHTGNVTNMSGMFENCEKVTDLRLGPNFDTSSVTNMSGMFHLCRAVKNLDLSSFDTSNVTNMSGMFQSCVAVKNFDLSSFNTSNVTDMSNMFEFSLAAEQIDLSSFDTRKVKSFQGMFATCRQLQEVKWSTDKFSTEQATNMNTMFSGCIALTELDLSRFKTENVDNMSSMFSGCEKLSRITFGDKFITAQVVNMSRMFRACKALTKLELPNTFTADKLTAARYMFSGCENLEELNFNQFKPTELRDVNDMFSNCKKLESLDLSEWVFRDPGDMSEGLSRLFKETESLNSLKLGNANWTQNVKWNMREMFYGSAVPSSDIQAFLNEAKPKPTSLEETFAKSKITELDLSGLDLSELTDMHNAFTECPNLTSVNLSGHNLAKLDYYHRCEIFKSCSKLTQVDLSNTTMPKVPTLNGMFDGCTKLETVNLLGFEAPMCQDFRKMFFNCSSLTAVDFGDKASFAKAKHFSEMFANCYALKSVKNLKFDATDNAVTSFNIMFSGCKELTDVQFVLPDGKAEFPNLTHLTAMFGACDKLTEISLGGTWVAPNLTNTNTMFGGCKSLKQITLDFEDVKAIESGFTANDMFLLVPADAKLYLTASGDVCRDAIQNAFDNRTKGALEDPIMSAPMAPVISEVPTVPEVPEVPEEPETSAPTEETPDTENVTNTGDAAKKGTETENMTENVTNTGEAAEKGAETETVTSSVTDGTLEATSVQRGSGALLRSYAPQTSALEATSVQRDSGAATPAKPTTSDPNVKIHHEQTNQNDDVTYRVRVKYVGDPGAQSSLIDVALPLPENLTADPNPHITVGSLTSTSGGVHGGYVVGTPSYDTASKTLKAQINALAAGCYIEFNITYRVNALPTQQFGNYKYWDATAQVADRNGSVQSNVYRLWNHQPTSVNSTPYQLRYAYTGDVPAGVTLPAAKTYAQGDNVTAAAKPTGAPSYYTFDGWTRSDNGGTVAPGDTFNMPNSNLTLTGHWTLKEADVPTVTVNYAYDGTAPANAPAAPAEKTVKVTETYMPKVDVLRKYSDLYYKLGSGTGVAFTYEWTPTLYIGGTEVTLTKGADGVYSGAGSKYRISAVGTTDMQQFKDDVSAAQKVEITYHASWVPYQGTIRYHANGGDTQSNPETVEDPSHPFATPYTLKTLGTAPGQIKWVSAAANIQFGGWATAPVGMPLSSTIKLSDLLRDDGDSLDLYAQWYMTGVNHGVVLDLTNVTAADTTTHSVTAGNRYQNKLTVAPGYTMQSVYVQMGGAYITKAVYNAATGVVTIPQVTGDVVIRATASKPASPTPTPTPTPNPNPNPGGGGGGSEPKPNPNPTPSVKPTVTNPTITGVANWLNTENHIVFMNGYDNGRFGPDDSLTRAQTCQMFYNLLLEKDVPVTVTFPDVPESAWYAKAVNTMAALGVVYGTNDGTFKPDRPITRAEFTAIATRFAKADDHSALEFRDVSVNDWFYAPVLTAVNYGWIAGMDRYTFQPYAKITRAQAATIVNRMLARSADQSYADSPLVRRFPDVPASYWAYYQILEASNAHGFTYDQKGVESWTGVHGSKT